MPKANRVHSTPPTNTAIAPFTETPALDAGAFPLVYLRHVATVAIDHLIAFLDATDGYTADEREADDSDNESSLGWARAGALGGSDDLEINEVAL